MPAEEIASAEVTEMAGHADSIATPEAPET